MPGVCWTPGSELPLPTAQPMAHVHSEFGEPTAFQYCLRNTCALKQIKIREREENTPVMGQAFAGCAIPSVHGEAYT